MKVLNTTFSAFLLTLLMAIGPTPSADGQVAVRKAQRPTVTKTARKARASKRAKARPARVKQGLIRAAQKQPKFRTANQLAGQIRPGSSVFIPVGHSVAKSVLIALSKKANLDPKNPIKIVSLSNTASKKFFDTPGIVANSVFIAGSNRDAIAAGRGDFVPLHLSRVPGMIANKSLHIDVAVIQVSPPDKDGIVSLGPTAAATLAAIKVAKTVIAEVNPNVPRTFGATRIHQSKIDFMVKSDRRITTVEPSTPSKVDVRIAKHVMGLIPKNPTLQFGKGLVPDAVAGLLGNSGRKDIKIHSEMISDGTMSLVKSGAVRGKVVYSFALGSQKMLNWMDNNKKLESQTADVVNSVVNIAKIPNMLAINTALRVDLAGQANAQYVGGRNYSGTGGQQDFFRGAMLSPGGKAIMALPSTSKLKNADGSISLVSRITFQLGHNDIVTTGMHDLQYVVTEYGVAHIDGLNMRQRAEALIKVAHPKFRKGLRAQLKEQAKERKDAVAKRGS